MSGTDTMDTPPMWTRWLVLLIAGITGACSRQNDRADPPPNPEVMEVPVVSYVPIDEKLTEPCAWRREAPQTAIHSVARERKGCLEKYEADRSAIRKIQGRPVPAIRPANEQTP